MLTRLNQYLAKNTGISRRQADELISKSKVKINGKIAELGQKVDEEKDNIEVVEKWATKKVDAQKVVDTTILFYKPIFCLTTRKDPQGRKTIYDFLPHSYHNLKPAGRLDYMSEGLLIMSNDGKLINELTHPKYESNKSYIVGLNQPLTSIQIDQAKSGNMEIDEYQINPVLITELGQGAKEKFTYLGLDKKLSWYHFELSEGRNNQIRKMCEFFNKKVVRLIRSKQGEYGLDAGLYKSKTLEIKV
jgi:23S rRNA pseudouridine2605 synthase